MGLWVTTVQYSENNDQVYCNNTCQEAGTVSDVFEIPKNKSTSYILVPQHERLRVRNKIIEFAVAYIIYMTLYIHLQIYSSY